MFSAKLIFFCTVLVILSVTISVPAPDTHEEYDLALTKTNIQHPEEVSFSKKSRKEELATVNSQLAKSLLGY